MASQAALDSECSVADVAKLAKAMAQEDGAADIDLAPDGPLSAFLSARLNERAGEDAEAIYNRRDFFFTRRHAQRRQQFQPALRGLASTLGTSDSGDSASRSAPQPPASAVAAREEEVARVRVPPYHARPGSGVASSGGGGEEGKEDEEEAEDEKLWEVWQRPPSTSQHAHVGDPSALERQRPAGLQKCVRVAAGWLEPLREREERGRQYKERRCGCASWSTDRNHGQPVWVLSHHCPLLPCRYADRAGAHSPVRSVRTLLKLKSGGGAAGIRSHQMSQLAGAMFHSVGKKASGASCAHTHTHTLRSPAVRSIAFAGGRIV